MGMANQLEGVGGDHAKDESIEGTLKGYDLNPLCVVEVEVFQRQRGEVMRPTTGGVDVAFGEFSN
jgi:hypothetical protein